MAAKFVILWQLIVFALVEYRSYIAQVISRAEASSPRYHIISCIVLSVGIQVHNFSKSFNAMHKPMSISPSILK